jgi:hypothetical protein
MFELDEEAAIPTCNLSETIHNKWQQASGKNVTDLYNATLDDYLRAAMQSVGYQNFLKGGGSGTGPDRSALKLRTATRSGDPKKIAQAVSEVSGAAGLNSRIPHLEGEYVFGSTKRKLDLPPGDESDSHRHDRVNFTVPKLGRNSTPSQSRRRKGVADSDRDGSIVIAYSKNAIPVQESICNPLAWRIERIGRNEQCRCKGRTNGKPCKSRIAKYNRPVPAPTFTGIERPSKSKLTLQAQFWFCSMSINGCISDLVKSILHYPDIPDVWPIAVGTNLSQIEVEDLEAAGFVLDDRVECVKEVHTTLLKTHSTAVTMPSHIPAKGRGDIRPTLRERKPFRFVSEPSSEHMTKMVRSREIPCTSVKILKVPPPGYGVVYTVFTPESVEKQQLYNITIGDFPSCSCLGFLTMKTSALGNGQKKWIYCKHIYFVLQRFMGCTIDDTFVHSPAYTFNEVQMLLKRAEAIEVTPNVIIE